MMTVTRATFDVVCLLRFIDDYYAIVDDCFMITLSILRLSEREALL